MTPQLQMSAALLYCRRSTCRRIDSQGMLMLGWPAQRLLRLATQWHCDTEGFCYKLMLKVAGPTDKLL